LILAAAIQFGLWSEGWIRFVVDGFNVPRGPLGLLCYLPFVPIYWFVPRRHRPAYLWVTSLVLALVTLGPAYAGMLAGLTFGSLGIIRLCGVPRWSGIGKIVLALAFSAFIFFPQPPWLPPVKLPVYFYVHWAGLAYLFLRVYHVLVDVSAGKLPPPRAGDFLAYLLFAPTLRMGPLYRFGEFARQMTDGPIRHRDFAGAGIRFATGAVRLAAMVALRGALPDDVLYEHPERLGAIELILHLQSPTLALYLWISGYVDWSIAVGRLLGFEVPDNFNYPWRSLNIGEFWRRWHITLSNWLKDYLFIPLVRRRWHYFWAFTLTFLFCGYWHGIRPSYILFGLSQGVGLAVHRRWDQLWRRQRDHHTPLYATLVRLKLAQSPLNVAARWAITYSYLILSIDLAIDERHTFQNVVRRVLSLVGILPD